MTQTHHSNRLRTNKEGKRMRKSMAGLAIALILGLVVSACGGSDKSSSDNKTGSPATGKTGKKGGALTVISAADVDSLDPGYWYYQYDYMVGMVAQRFLYGWKPEATTVTPDLAQGLPQASDGGKTVTIKIKPGIKYSAPLQNRTVTAKDFKYALERDFLPQVANGYAGSYYAEIAGVKPFQSGKAKEISGITAPDDQTLVLKLNRPQGAIATGVALALPGTTPVPKDYAAKYDKGKQSTYGQHQVFVGPYMISNDGKGKLTGYVPGKKIELVRNPSWDPKTDYRPAYLDKITFLGGNDLTVGSRKILSGQSMVSGDFAAPPTAVLKSALSTNKSQLSIQPSQGNRYIALNSAIKPFDNLNVRKAVQAVINKNALRLTRGGPTLGPIATHFIPPEMPGFEEAGGQKGPGFDFVSNPNGDLKLAMSYMKKGGFPSGKYTGPALLMVGDNQPPASKTGEAIQSQLETLGFKLNYRQVEHSTAISKFCGVPKSQVAICPNLGWGKDFFDSQSLLDPVFNGKNIVPAGNVNTAQANDPKINAAMDKAEEIVDPAARAKAWADIDKQVTEQAYVVTWLWDNGINFASKNVNAVRNKFNSAWDLAYTSLK
ncbi:MAG: peptide/nickel transport system substrate-binding protein [Thermoleophilaceae bacterium]|nr:peptide/nickel transport system substrate-binding protein [Thermoleophilaceae bacterium]